MCRSPKISVVIPTYNRRSYLYACLEGVFNQDYNKDNYEVIVVDDGSNDGTFDMLSKYAAKHSNMKPISYRENRGISYSRNRGVDVSSGKYIAFLDSDCIPLKGWFREIEMLLDVANRPCIQGTQKDAGTWGSYNLHEGLELINSLKKLNRLDTKNLVLERRLGLEHRFDQSLFRSGDIDLAMKLKKAGVPVYYSDKVCVFHMVNRFSEVLQRARDWGKGQAQVFVKYGCAWGNYTNRNLGRPLFFNLAFYSSAFIYQLIRYHNLRGALGRMVLRIVMSIHFKKELKKLSLTNMQENYPS
jgi:glycosyltransferase involved in cell wall biosynthesis